MQFFAHTNWFDFGAAAQAAHDAYVQDESGELEGSSPHRRGTLERHV